MTLNSPSDDRHFQQVYDELRALASRRVRQGLAGSSLQATALVHEVWLKLSDAGEVAPRDASHYYATAAQAMRWILVDRARRRRNRRTEQGAASLDDLAPQSDAEALEVFQLDEALARLEHAHPRKAQVVLHRHFAGLSVEETARVLEVSTATVKREWRFARAWLLREMGAGPGGGPEKGEES